MSIDTIFAMAKAETVRLIKYGKCVSTLGNILVPLAIALICTFYSDIMKVDVALFLILLIIFGIIQTALAFANFSTPHTVQEAYFLAQPIHEENSRQKQEIKILQDKILDLVIIQDVSLAWNIMQRSFLKKIDTRVDFEGVIKRILSQIILKSENIFIFGAEEYWNFALYMFDSKSNRLRLVWREKHPRHPSAGTARSWSAGQGHVGKAFANREALITGDATNPEIAPLLAAPAGLAREHDAIAYRSIASIPIDGADEKTDPVGVIVATSNRVGRFNQANCLILRHAAAVLASVVASRGLPHDLFTESSAD